MLRDEHTIQKNIIKYLKSLNNCFVQRREAGTPAYKKGMPDLYCVYKGVHYEIECKDPKGETSIMQDKQRIILENAGCVYILAKTLDDVTSIIK